MLLQVPLVACCIGICKKQFFSSTTDFHTYLYGASLLRNRYLITTVGLLDFIPMISPYHWNLYRSDISVRTDKNENDPSLLGILSVWNQKRIFPCAQRKIFFRSVQLLFSASIWVLRRIDSLSSIQIQFRWIVFYFLIRVKHPFHLEIS